MKLNDITIKVHHFGPLENVSFKLAPMMVFMGKSSLGKSYANYLVYYFMSSVCNGKLFDFIPDEGDEEIVYRYEFSIDSFFKELEDQAEEFMRKFLADDELSCDVEFKSSKRKRSFTIEVKKLKNTRTNSLEGEEPTLFHEPPTFEIGFNGGARFVVHSFNHVRYYTERKIHEFLLGAYFTRAVILPPGRGAFAGENFSLKREVAASMNMYNLFFQDYDNGISSRIRLKEEVGNHLSGRLLKMTSGGELISVDGKQYIQLDQSHKIALSAGASSVKDLAPWLFYLKNYWMMPCSFCMEEPEAHQHPEVTVQIADVMAIVTHQLAAYLFHLTTHSDYLIQRLNQLVKLGSIRRKDEALFKSICEERGLDPQSYLDADTIHAYFFKKDKKGKTSVEKLDVSEEGIPMNSFFEVVRDLNEREDYINEALYRLEKAQA